MERDLEYDAVVESVAVEMVPRMKDFLTQVKNELEHYGYTTKPIIDLTDCEYRFDFEAVRPDGLSFNIELLMIEERVNEPDDDSYGVSFMFGITKQGGLLVDDISPYNFTSHIWEPDLRDIQTVLGRWYLLVSAVFDTNIVLLMDEEKLVAGRI